MSNSRPKGEQRAQSSNGQRKQQLDTNSSLHVPQNAILPTESYQEELSELRDAIIELYLAIKIRSTEEVSELAAFPAYGCV